MDAAEESVQKAGVSTLILLGERDLRLADYLVLDGVSQVEWFRVHSTGQAEGKFVQERRDRLRGR